MPTTTIPAGALTHFINGNRRSVEERLKHPHKDREWRTSLTEGQHPFAVILTCSDSRVASKIIFDQGLGDLFVIRVAGNVVQQLKKAQSILTRGVKEEDAQIVSAYYKLRTEEVEFFKFCISL